MTLKVPRKSVFKNFICQKFLQADVTSFFGGHPPTHRVEVPLLLSVRP